MYNSSIPMARAAAAKATLLNQESQPVAEVMVEMSDTGWSGIFFSASQNLAPKNVQETVKWLRISGGLCKIQVFDYCTATHMLRPNTPPHYHFDVVE
jgi:hypothetical protein